MAGRPDPRLASACRLALAVYNAGTLLDYANTEIAPEHRLDLVCTRDGHPDFGKPRFSAGAARNLLREELERVCERDPDLRAALETVPDRRAAFAKLVDAVEWFARKSSFTLDRARRRRVGRAARRNRSTRGPGAKSSNAETWLEQVHEVARAAGLTGATNAGSFANAWRAWKRRVFPDGRIIMGVSDIP